MKAWEAPVYLKLRQTAQRTGRWDELYPQVAAEMRAHVLAVKGQQSYPVRVLTEAGLLGYAYLLEGDWQKAVEWASNAAVPVGWRDDDPVGVVATGLVRIGIAALEKQSDDVLTQALQEAPEIIREHGDLLEPVARSLSAGPLLDNAVQLYEHLVTRAISGKERSHYARAGGHCVVIRSIRRLQGREADFERYCQGLFSIYSRYSALKDELRLAVEGPSYRRAALEQSPRFEHYQAALELARRIGESEARRYTAEVVARLRSEARQGPLLCQVYLYDGDYESAFGVVQDVSGYGALDELKLVTKAYVLPAFHGQHVEGEYLQDQGGPRQQRHQRVRQFPARPSADAGPDLSATCGLCPAGGTRLCLYPEDAHRCRQQALQDGGVLLRALGLDRRSHGARRDV